MSPPIYPSCYTGDKGVAGVTGATVITGTDNRCDDDDYRCECACCDGGVGGGVGADFAAAVVAGTPGVSLLTSGGGCPTVNVVSGVEIDAFMIDASDVSPDISSESSVFSPAPAPAPAPDDNDILPPTGVSAAAGPLPSSPAASSDGRPNDCGTVTIPASWPSPSPTDRNDVSESPGPGPAPGFPGASNGGGGVALPAPIISASFLCAIAASLYSTPDRPTDFCELMKSIFSTVGPLDGYWNAARVSGAEMREEGAAMLSGCGWREPSCWRLSGRGRNIVLVAVPVLVWGGDADGLDGRECSDGRDGVMQIKAAEACWEAGAACCGVGAEIGAGCGSEMRRERRDVIPQMPLLVRRRPEGGVRCWRLLQTYLTRIGRLGNIVTRRPHPTSKTILDIPNYPQSLFSKTSTTNNPKTQAPQGEWPRNPCSPERNWVPYCY
ncbi:hypothetical protein BU17DRAFT_71061 [Hysterangium stoloniferum]|nr:hypothetical protein BU17DRAFT_71061 [Hysterangium stoloniferum]